MRIAAKAVLDGGYWGHGRKWPRTEQLEVEVTPDEYASIAADPHIVCIVIPEAPQRTASDVRPIASVKAGK